MKKLAFISLFIILFQGFLAAAEPYIEAYNNKEYKKSLALIEEKLKEFYLDRIDDKRIPSGFISMNNTEKEVDLMKVFREKKVSRFFIEDNPAMVQLHLYAGRCHGHSKLPIELSKALSHYIQSFRFKEKISKSDSPVFYEMSQIYKRRKEFYGYVNHLDMAIQADPDNIPYNRELGLALSSTAHTTKALYHLRKALDNDSNIEPRLYLIAASMYETERKFLEADTMYDRYLKRKPDDGAILFAYGYLLYYHTGNHNKARVFFNRALAILPSQDFYRRSKSHEYLGNMLFQDLDYPGAAKQYLRTIAYQEKIEDKLASLRVEKKKLQKKINVMKKDILTNPNFSQYEEYEELLDEKGRIERKVDITFHALKKLNRGRIRWNLARVYKRMERFRDSISRYEESISYRYRTVEAREEIVKIRLKIKRGY